MEFVSPILIVALSSGLRHLSVLLDICLLSKRHAILKAINFRSTDCGLIHYIKVSYCDHNNSFQHKQNFQARLPQFCEIIHKFLLKHYFLSFNRELSIDFEGKPYPSFYKDVTCKIVVWFQICEESKKWRTSHQTALSLPLNHWDGLK
jgi:hypothetical protein